MWYKEVDLLEKIEVKLVPGLKSHFPPPNFHCSRIVVSTTSSCGRYGI